MQAGLLLKRRAEQSGQAVKFGPNGKLIKGLLNNLPFSLTKGQTEAFADIVNDTETQVPMQRLVQEMSDRERLLLPRWPWLRPWKTAIRGTDGTDRNFGDTTL